MSENVSQVAQVAVVDAAKKRKRYHGYAGTDLEKAYQHAKQHLLGSEVKPQPFVAPLPIEDLPVPPQMQKRAKFQSPRRVKSIIGKMRKQTVATAKRKVVKEEKIVEKVTTVQKRVDEKAKAIIVAPAEAAAVERKDFEPVSFLVSNWRANV